MIRKVIIITLILFALVLFTFSFPSIDRKSSLEGQIIIEKQAEANYIHQDALITSKLNLQPVINQLRQQLIKEDYDYYERKNLQGFSEQIISIEPILNRPSLINLINNQADETIISLIESHDEKDFIEIVLPITRNNRVFKYKITLKIDYFSEIEKKQQLRMYTVTHLQNNRWKTIPTKYNPQKKLTLNIERSLPNIQPKVEEKGISHYIKDELIIKFKESSDDNYINSILRRYDLKVKKRLDHTFIVNCDNQMINDLIKKLEVNEINTASSKIEYIEPHFIYLTNESKKKDFHYKAKPLIPNDSLYLDYQWNLPLISAEEGWRWTKGKADVIIAVIDTGVDLDHPEFKGRLVKGINIIDPSLPPMDDDGHGTHVAGIISANTNNNEGIAGITWYNKIMPIKVLDQAGAGTLFDVAEGIFWATDHGAKVINLSLGNYAESKFLHDAIKYAYNNDVVLVAATGNDNTNEYGYPAAYPEVISVSAIDYHHRRAEFSNYGNYVDVVAPGVNIPSTYPDNQYVSLSGTSMSSPHVAGLAGLLRSINPSLTNASVNQIIKETASDLGSSGKDSYYGYGEINIEKAIANSNELTGSRSITLIWLQAIKQRF